jgi:hypothetical protein
MRERKLPDLEILKLISQEYCPILPFERIPPDEIEADYYKKGFSINRNGHVTCLGIHTIEGSRFKAFPKRICQLVHLEKLSLGCHAIQVLPNCITNLTQLHYLDLSENPIKGIPECLKPLPLQKLWLDSIPQFPFIHNILDHVKLSEIEGDITEEKLRVKLLPLIEERKQKFEKAVDFIENRNPFIFPPDTVINRFRDQEGGKESLLLWCLYHNPGARGLDFREFGTFFTLRSFVRKGLAFNEGEYSIISRKGEEAYRKLRDDFLI